MKATHFLATIVAAVGFAGAALADDPAKVGQTNAGPTLTDASGMTLYTYTRDMPGASNCNGPCADAWPPLVAAASDKGAGDWSVVRRDDGKLQWAYKGQPLYHYGQDKTPGDTTGDGAAGGKWRIAKP